MKKKVYIETSVISYLTSKMSRDLIIAAHQQITQDWWENYRSEFDLYVSELVISEASAGNAKAVKKRLQILYPLPRVVSNKHVLELARKIIADRVLPPKATDDAFHIAIASVHQMDYLLTWNCKHIANAHIQKNLRELIQQQGYESPVMCTPEELMRE
jgi:predicted nucleic acid-binding protein